jgi:gas vesicle protein
MVNMNQISVPEKLRLIREGHTIDTNTSSKEFNDVFLESVTESFNYITEMSLEYLTETDGNKWVERMKKMIQWIREKISQLMQWIKSKFFKNIEKAKEVAREAEEAAKKATEPPKEPEKPKEQPRPTQTQKPAEPEKPKGPPELPKRPDAKYVTIQIPEVVKQGRNYSGNFVDRAQRVVAQVVTSCIGNHGYAIEPDEYPEDEAYTTEKIMKVLLKAGSPQLPEGIENLSELYTALFGKEINEELRVDRHVQSWSKFGSGWVASIVWSDEDSMKREYPLRKGMSDFIQYTDGHIKDRIGNFIKNCNEWLGRIENAINGIPSDFDKDKEWTKNTQILTKGVMVINTFLMLCNHVIQANNTAILKTTSELRKLTENNDHSPPHKNHM